MRAKRYGHAATNIELLQLTPGLLINHTRRHAVLWAERGKDDKGKRHVRDLSTLTSD